MMAMIVCLWGLASAQLTYDVANYKALADADSPETIPLGTTITVQNWQKYRKFMQMWKQAAYSGQYKWHVGAEPEYTVEVGPTHHFPMYQNLSRTLKSTAVRLSSYRFRAAASVGKIMCRYSISQTCGTKPCGQARLRHLANFRPKIMDFIAYNWLVDNYGNVTNLQSDDSFFRLMHLSDPPGGPINLPTASGTYYASRFTVIQPEQSKYTTELTLRPDDPTRLEEIYVFLPSLRRSLRLSSAARCSPILSTDFVEDDNAWLPPNFKITLLGKKNLLAPVMEYDKAFQKDSYLRPPTAFP